VTGASGIDEGPVAGIQVQRDAQQHGDAQHAEPTVVNDQRTDPRPAPCGDRGADSGLGERHRRPALQALTELAVATRPAWLRPLDDEPDPGVAHDDWTAHLAAALTHADLNKLVSPGFTARPSALHRTTAPAPHAPICWPIFDDEHEQQMLDELTDWVEWVR
jgi:hypothetical protein